MGAVDIANEISDPSGGKEGIREHIEVLTDIYKVAEYNNRYFAPFWDKMQPCDIQF